MAIGAAFAVVGLVDLSLVWFPTGFGNATWEFAALSQTFSNIPLTGLSLVLVAYGLVRHPAVGVVWVRGAAVAFAVVAVVVLVMSFLFVTVVPEITRQTPAEGAEAVIRVVIKNGVEAVIYPIAFGLISLLLWRGTGKEK